ncbi:interleukin-17D isoform X2 [Fukomys damarensis]|uniref:interleukin-17D isoform X2 n=1 Tax=Fukomys damarensis TaxID=885580 RepID=UPI000540272C|nr:interleukin-17D isoform X2 [Fukomys damarensis]
MVFIKNICKCCLLHLRYNKSTSSPVSLRSGPQMDTNIPLAPFQFDDFKMFCSSSTFLVSEENPSRSFLSWHKMCACTKPTLFHRISYDPARFPRYLPEAYCLCRGCLTGPFGEEDFRFRSTPVYMPTVVLRRTSACAGGRSVYTEAYVTVPVGCTCVPELQKDTASINSSIDKQGAKLLLGPSDEPDRYPGTWHPPIKMIWSTHSQEFPTPIVPGFPESLLSWDSPLTHVSDLLFPGAHVFLFWFM